MARVRRRLSRPHTTRQDGKPGFVVAEMKVRRTRKELRRTSTAKGVFRFGSRSSTRKKGCAKRLSCHRCRWRHRVAASQSRGRLSGIPIRRWCRSLRRDHQSAHLRVEGEKDVETERALAACIQFRRLRRRSARWLRAIRRSAGGGNPRHNDHEGRKHVGKESRTRFERGDKCQDHHLRELQDKQDVSDWAAIAGNTLVEFRRSARKGEPWRRLRRPSCSGSDIKAR